MAATTPTPDTHRVVARTTDGRYVTHRDLLGLTWNQAQEAWTKLDNARRAGRLPLVEYLVVRSTADPDPRWHIEAGEWTGPTDPPIRGKAYLELVPFVFGRQQGMKDRNAACKAWGLAHGYKGAKGGWIYRAADLERERSGGRRARAYGQGWDTLITGVLRNSRVIRHEGRYYWNDLDGLYAAEEVAA